MANRTLTGTVKMKTYIFLHGALRGAWLWDKLIPLLQKGGAKGIALDLPGHGKRAEERKGVNMSVYIRDVLSYIEKNDLRDLILVGHSMSGIVITKVADEMPERIRHLVYLAAVVPRDGDALIDLLTQERQEALRKLEGKANEIYGPLASLRPLYFTDLKGEIRDHYVKKLTPQPLAVFFEKIHLKQFTDLKIPRTYILGLQDKSLPHELTRGFAERLGVEPIEIDAGHDMMVSRAEEVAEALLRIP
jgi:pimeloyl-ACP methyl ester carboxylesterase